MGRPWVTPGSLMGLECWPTGRPRVHSSVLVRGPPTDSYYSPFHGQPMGLYNEWVFHESVGQPCEFLLLVQGQLMGLPRATPIHDFSRIVHGPAVGTAWVSHEPFIRHPFNSRERRPKVSMLYTYKGK